MKIKEPKPKKCAWSKCGKEFVPNPFRFNQRTCNNTMCAMGFVRDKEAKKEAKEWGVQKAEMKEKLKTLTDYENEAKEVYQHFIRLRDKDLPCISCGKSDCKDWAGGHYFAAGQFSGLIFDEDNCHKQCNSYCNKFLHGNNIQYRIGLVDRYGEKFVKALEMRSNRNRKYRYTREELIEIKEYYKQKVKELQ